jgi:hypothetical protein
MTKKVIDLCEEFLNSLKLSDDNNIIGFETKSYYSKNGRRTSDATKVIAMLRQLKENYSIRDVKNRYMVLIFATVLIEYIYNKLAGYDEHQSKFKALLACKYYCDKYGIILLTDYSALKKSEFEKFENYEMAENEHTNIYKLYDRVCKKDTFNITIKLIINKLLPNMLVLCKELNIEKRETESMVKDTIAFLNHEYGYYLQPETETLKKYFKYNPVLYVKRIFDDNNDIYASNSEQLYRALYFIQVYTSIEEDIDDEYIRKEHYGDIEWVNAVPKDTKNT